MSLGSIMGDFRSRVAAAQAAQGGGADAYGTARGDIAGLFDPYTKAGEGALGDLQGMLKKGFQPGDLTQEPGYKFALDQGLKATQNAAGVQGSPFGGAAMAEMTKYATGQAEQTYNNAFQRWQGQVSNFANLAGLGANAAGAQATGIANLFGSNVGAEANRYGSDRSVDAAGKARGGSFFGAIGNMTGLF